MRCIHLSRIKYDVTEGLDVNYAWPATGQRPSCSLQSKEVNVTKNDFCPVPARQMLDSSTPGGVR